MTKFYKFPEEKWFGNNGENEEPTSHREIKFPVFPKGKKFLWILVACVVLVFLAFPFLANFYIDYLWFDAQNQTAVFWTMLIPKWILFGVATLLSFVLLFFNFRIARHNTLKLLPPDSPFGNIPQKLTSTAVLIGAGAFALINGASTQKHWDMILRFLNSAPFGNIDPIFGKDISFYIYRLPFWSFAQEWGLGILILSLIGSAALYAFVIAPLVAEHRGAVPKAVFKHLSLLVAAIALLWAVGFWLDRFNLLYSPRGVAFGASYTDIHADLLALNLMTGLTLLVSVLLIVGIYKSTWKFSAITLGFLVLASVILRGIYPGIIQKYVVEPNEFDKERPYIEHNIEATLQAYDLKKVKTVSMLPESEVTWEKLEMNKGTMQNVRLWDSRPLLRSFKQLQEIRSYYDFIDVDIDRYRFNGQYRQVMIAARELDLKRLQNPTWVNQHVEFTHGYGLVMNPVNEVSSSGLPILWIENLPPRIHIPVELERPQIYYGEKPDSYVFVNTTEKEFDYPMDNSNARTTYEGTGGVSIGSFFRRMLFAMKYGDSKILFTTFFTPESRILLYRNVQQRLHRLAPFLLYDSDPYLVIHNGRLVWIQDAYTISDRYPYSEPISVSAGSRKGYFRINYIRNSVKATVDAYDGTVQFFIADKADPLIQTWDKIFPSLFKPMEEMSPNLREHIRYPKDIFSVQSEILKTYHMLDPNTFYNKEDVWQTYRGSEGTEQLAAHYMIMKLEDTHPAEFALITPFMPIGRDNMIAWMAGRCDGDSYGEVLVYTFPKQKLIYGPAQVEALTNQHPEISAQLSLWSQRGSDVIKGNIMVIPIEDAVLYVQPLYLKAENSDLPELKRVIVSTGGRVVWDERLDNALEKLLRKPTTLPSLRVPTTPEGEKEEKSVIPSYDGNIKELVQQAQDAWSKAQDALREGNWNQYGEMMQRVESILQHLGNVTQ